MTRKNTIVRYTLGEIKKRIANGKSKTRRDAPEGPPPPGENFCKCVRLVMPRGARSVNLPIDSDIFDWFKTQGKGHLARMNAVLRSYVRRRRGVPYKA